MFQIGDKVHYSGDMANAQGWFRVAGHDGRSVYLVEEGHSRSFHVPVSHIGDVYQGHCSPRFVTEAAVLAYRAALEAK